MLASVVIPAVACLMYAGAAAWVLPALPAVPPVTGSAAWIASVVPVLGITALCVMHAWAFKCRRAGEPSSLLIHAMNGFYVGIVVGRALDRIHALVRSAILGDHRA